MNRPWLCFWCGVVLVLALGTLSGCQGTPASRLLEARPCQQNSDCLFGLVCVGLICQVPVPVIPEPPPSPKDSGPRPDPVTRPEPPPQPDTTNTEPIIPEPSIQIDSPLVICQPGETQPCYTGPQGTAGTGICRGGNRPCVNGRWSTTCDQQVLPRSSETCGNGIDDNCDGQTDEGCGGCQPGLKRPCGPVPNGICRKGEQLCLSNGTWGACDGAVEPRQEACNGIDDNCDGQIDDGNPDGGGACSTGLSAPCGAGLLTCVQGSLDCLPKVALSPESCNGKDDDCDGQVDEGNPGGGASCDTTLLGACKAGTSSCQAGTIVCNQNAQPVNEICHDNKDNDCDGQTDEGCHSAPICQPCTNRSACGKSGGRDNHCTIYPYTQTSGNPPKHCVLACNQDSDCPKGFACRSTSIWGQSKYCGPPANGSFYGMWYCPHYNNLGQTCSQRSDCGPVFTNRLREGGFCHKGTCTVFCQKDADCPIGSCRATVKVGGSDRKVCE